MYLELDGVSASLVPTTTTDINGNREHLQIWRLINSATELTQCESLLRQKKKKKSTLVSSFTPSLVHSLGSLLS